MDLVLCHTTADFDTLGAAIGLARLRPGARVVLTGGAHPTVKHFLALHRDEYPLIERRSVTPEQIRTIAVVDTCWRDRLGKAAEWLDLPDVEIEVYDHHVEGEGDIAATQRQIEPVGAATTIVVEKLQAAELSLTLPEATVMALGIHADTGSLTFDHTTVRDAAALTWLMQQGASLRAIGEYVEPGLSPALQTLLPAALDALQTETIQGYTLAWVLLPLEEHVPGLSSLAARLISLTESDLLLFGAFHPIGGNDRRLSIIGRARGSGGSAEPDLGKLFEPLGGGGHARAAALTLRVQEPSEMLLKLVAQVKASLPHPPIARELMSSPVRTIRPETTIEEAQRILLRYGHSGLSVVDATGQLVGVISRRDLDIALHHGFSHAPVKGYMTPNLKTIAPDTPLPEIESLMVTYDIGRLPVLENQQLVGIVTRTDVLRQLHQDTIGQPRGTQQTYCLLPEVSQNLRPDAPIEMLRQRLTPDLWNVLTTAATQAEKHGWQLYVVGGAVRTLLLAKPVPEKPEPDETELNKPESNKPEPSKPEQPLLLDDIDLVVDGFHRSADQAAGVELARSLQKIYSQTRLQVHGRFQTAALLWHNDPDLDSLWVDIATARTEFYPYPAANPEVEASSIRQDLYRRDFTINALAIRLTPPRSGELLDFFGGLMDLRARLIRVLHANSFIEDPTRIYRAVRFAVRLGFQIEGQTEGYIRHAIASGVYDRVLAQAEKAPALQTRLKQELKYILEAAYWKAAIQQLAELGALSCIHPTLALTDRLWWRLRLVDRWLKRFDPQAQLDHWQVLLEVMLAELEPPHRDQVAEQFQLANDSLDRLEHLEQTCTAISEGLSGCDRPSQAVRLLEGYSLATLTLLSAVCPRLVRQQIWRYLTRWSAVKAPLTGEDLKAMGYKPGRQYKDMLESLLVATLDGELETRSAAEAFIQQQFPQEG